MQSKDVYIQPEPQSNKAYIQPEQNKDFYSQPEQSQPVKEIKFQPELQNIPLPVSVDDDDEFIPPM